MSYEDKIMDFLAQEENLPIAFEVAEYVEKLKEQVHQEFWEQFPTVFEEHLKNSEFPDEWKLIPFNQDRLTGRYEHFGLKPRTEKTLKGSTLGVYMEQGTLQNEFRLLLGVILDPEPTEPVSDEIADLVNELRLLGRTKSSNHWPGWNWIDYRLRGERFILRMKQDPEKLLKEIAEVYWKFFLHIRPFVLAALEKGAKNA